MSVRFILIFIVFANMVSCKKEECLLEPVAKGLEYIEENDKHFKKCFNDSIFLYNSNFDLNHKENCKVNYPLIGGSFWNENKDTIFFEDLNLEIIDNNELLICFSKYIDPKKIVLIENDIDLDNQYAKLKELQKNPETEKWLFSIICFRKNDKYAIFRILYQTGPRAYLGCDFIYDYSKKDFIEKVCDFPFYSK